MPDRTCSFDGCDKPHYGLGLCRGHWKQKRRTGKLAPLRSYQFGRICTIEGCGREHSAQGLCRLHHERLLRTGSVEADKPPQIRGDDAARLARRLVPGENGCVEYVGTPARSGHIQMWFRGRMDGAHRVAWILANGPIPAGLCVCHHCDNPPCCNVDHLFLGTVADNNADRDRKGRGVMPR